MLKYFVDIRHLASLLKSLKLNNHKSNKSILLWCEYIEHIYHIHILLKYIELNLYCGNQINYIKLNTNY